jgi:DNA repair protein RecN (Recombination protein N)
MLQRLSICNIVLIERLDLDLTAGLCVLTGETGAGKSILLDALGLALGARADQGLLREGAELGSVAAEVDLAADHPLRAHLAEHGIETGDPLVVRRTLGADGRSRAFIDDQPVSVGLLRETGARLVEIQGQRDQMGLLDAATHRTILDAFGGHDAELDALGAAHAAWTEADEAHRATAQALVGAREDEAFLRHALDELDHLDPTPGEADALAVDRRRLMHGEKLREALEDAQNALREGDGIEARLGISRRAVDDVRELAGGALDETAAALERAAIETAEAMARLAEAARNLDLDPARLDAVENRLVKLRSAARKHNVEPDALTGLRDELATRLDAIEHRDDDVADARNALDAVHRHYGKIAHALSARRQSAAQALDKAVMAEFAPLKLADARFAARLVPLDDETPHRHGLEKVVFEVAMNPGTASSPLQRVISGGELSRLLLALKVVLAGTDPVPTLIFDEVDQGVGGATAEAVGARLARLAQNVQVLVVTHSPQVAARADTHVRVAKQTQGKGVVTVLDPLSADTRREEIARMLAGTTVTDEARAAADRLIEGPTP